MESENQNVSSLSMMEMAKLRSAWTGKNEQGNVRRDAALEKLLENRNALNCGLSDLRGICLAGEDLSGIDFSRCDLSGADLSDAVLNKSKFIGAVLREALLPRSSLDHCQLVNSDLQGADFSECFGTNVGFGACQCQGSIFFGARLPEVTFSKSDLRETDFRTAVLSHGRICDARLQKANFAQADLQFLDLSESNVDDAVFSGTDMREAIFRGIRGFASAQWIGADIRQVDFCGAYLVRRHIVDENFMFEYRNQGGHFGILYFLWDLTSRCGRSMLRWSLCIAIVVILFALLYNIVEIDYGPYPTRLSPLYFSIVTITTLGYGDVRPISSAAQTLVMLQVLIGYLGLGGMLSIFANKMARRAD